MRHAAVTTLALGALLVTSGAQPRAAGGAAAVASPVSVEPAAMTQPIPEEPVYVHDVVAPATRGWRRANGGPRLVHLDDTLLSAYSFAVAVAPERCHLPLSLLAAIGQVESGNAAGHSLDAGHRVVPAILGPALDGTRFAAIPDTDGGLLDGDSRWDHAVGPFQFLPSSWRVAGVDFDDDGIRDPQDVYDAAGAAMVYLCAADRDLADPSQLESAVLSYNHSRSYLRTVLAWKAAFDGNGMWDGSPVGPFVATPVAHTAVTAQPVAAVTPVRPHGAVTTGATPDPRPLVREPVDVGPPVPVPADEPPVPPQDCAPAEPGPTEEPTDPPAGQPADLPIDPPIDPPIDSPTDPPPSEQPVDPPPPADPSVEPAPDQPPTDGTDQQATIGADDNCPPQPGSEGPTDPAPPTTPHEPTASAVKP
jgi:hypothetical protein